MPILTHQCVSLARRRSCRVAGSSCIACRRREQARRHVVGRAHLVNRMDVAMFLLFARMIVGITHLLLAWVLVAAGVSVLTRLR